mgnify:FL=1
MKNFNLSYARMACVAMLAGVVAACSGSSGDNGKDKPDPSPAMSVSPTKLSIPASGEAQVMEVNAEGISWIVTPSSSWIKVTPSEGNGSTEIRVSADENTDTAERTGSITFSGTGVSNIKVNVTQEAGKPKDVDMTVNTAEGYYMGDNLKSDKKLASVILVLSDGKTTSSNTLTYPCDVVQIPLVLKYAEYNKLDISGTYKVVAGDDAVAAENVVLAKSTSITHYVAADKATASYKPVSGEVKVEKSGESYNVTFAFVLDNGASYKGTSKGNLQMYNGTLETTLKGDFTPANATKATVSFQKFNDKLDVAVIDLVGKNKSGNYDDMMIMLLVDKTVQSSRNLTGNYVIDEEYESREENLVNSAIPGIAYEQGGNNYSYIGFWYLETNASGTDIVGNRAPGKSGKINIIKALDYSISYEVLDDAGNKITGSYNGPLTFAK